MMKKNGFLARVALVGAVAVAVFCTAGRASAATPGFYISGKYGQTSADMAGLDSARLGILMTRPWMDDFNILMWTDTRLDKEDQGSEIAVGYQFSPHLAVEGAYADLGNITYDVAHTVSNTGIDGSNARTRVVEGRRGPALSLVGTWPATGAIWLDAQAGAFFGRSAAKVTFGLEGDTPSQAKYTDRETSTFFGAGLNWSIWGKTAVRLGYTRFSKDALVGHEVDRFSLGVRVSF
jgi:hypothetical protein